MHEEKIWAMDFLEISKDDKEGDDEDSGDDSNDGDATGARVNR